MKKGKQRELIEREKEFSGLSWNKFADQLGIKFGKLNAFHYEECLISEEILNKFKLKKEYLQFIIEKKRDNWGKSKGGFNSSGRLKDIRIPKKSKDLAELWGILLGDGHVERTKGYKLGVYKLDIAGHVVDDFEYLVNYVGPLVEGLFGVKIRQYKHKTSKGMHILADRRRLIDYFEEQGFKSGNKIVNNVGIPGWIKGNNDYLAICLRGLFDTDGSFYKLTNQNSYQINFCNLNPRLLREVKDGLNRLGVSSSRIIGNKRIVITKKSEIEKFYKVIGFSNSKHLKKIKMLFEAL